MLVCSCLLSNGIFVTTVHCMAMISQLVVIIAKSVFKLRLHAVASGFLVRVRTLCRV